MKSILRASLSRYDVPFALFNVTFIELTRQKMLMQNMLIMFFHSHTFVSFSPSSLYFFPYCCSRVRSIDILGLKWKVNLMYLTRWKNGQVVSVSILLEDCIILTTGIMNAKMKENVLVSQTLNISVN